MIIDSIKNTDLYCGMHKSFPMVFAYLKKLSGLDEQGRFELEKDTVYGFIIEKETDVYVENALLERHKKFIDIHYILEGAETFAYQDKVLLEIVQEYSEKDDCELLRGVISEILLKSGYFCIVFPDDAHAPDCIGKVPQKVKRVVVKVRI